MNIEHHHDGGIVSEGAVDVPEAVRFTGLGRTTLYGLMDGGRLAYIKIGRRRLIPRAQLGALLAAGLVGDRSIVAATPTVSVHASTAKTRGSGREV